jgi:hypothetical protein
MQLALPVCDHDFLSTVVSQLRACRLQQQSVAQRVVCNCIAYQATVSVRHAACNSCSVVWLLSCGHCPLLCSPCLRPSASC